MDTLISRRAVMQLAASAMLANELRAKEAQRPCILLRSSWQVVNIGDIAHTPGVLALLEAHIPQADVILWASASLTDEVAEMEHRRFPNLRIVKGRIAADGRASTHELEEAIGRSDFLLHGSGPSFVAEKDVAAYVRQTNKPFGVYGITYGGASVNTRTLLSQAEFVFFRDSISLAKAKQDGVDSPIMEFGPDGAFAVDLRDDQSAQAFLRANGLQPGKFMCCIPRLRYTPYWTIRKVPMDQQRHAHNEEMREHDHAPLRETIAAITRARTRKCLFVQKT